MPNQRGTGFVNLGTWLGLNQGSAQGMANAIAGDVNAKGNAFYGGLQDAGSKFYDSIAGQFNRLKPTGPMSSEQATRLGGMNWEGPNGYDAATVTDLTQKASAAQNAANATGDNEGRQTLLQQHYGANTWGGGALDAALAGAGDSAQGLSTARGAFGRLTSSLKGVTDTAASVAAQNKADFQKFASNYAQQAPGLQQQEQQRAAQQRAQYRADMQARNVQRNAGWKQQPRREQDDYQQYP